MRAAAPARAVPCWAALCRVLLLLLLPRLLSVVCGFGAGGRRGLPGLGGAACRQNGVSGAAQQRSSGARAARAACSSGSAGHAGGCEHKASFDLLACIKGCCRGDEGQQQQ